MMRTLQLFNVAMQRLAFGICLSLSIFLPLSLSWSPPVSAADDPQPLIEKAVTELLDELVARRAELETDKRKLFELVERVVVPLFDLQRISRLVLAANWRQASDGQRDDFGEEFKKLLIGTYATALFKYTGEEKIRFTGSEIKERKGRKFAKVQSEITIGGGVPVVVEYALIHGKNGWKIYNLTIGGINMVTSYRNTYAASIGNLGLNGVIESMKAVNAKQW